MLVRMWRKGNPCALLVGMHAGTATVQNNMEFPQKTKNGTAFQSCNSTARIISSEPWNINPKEPMHPNAHSGTIYNSQVLEATWMPISKWMDQKTMVHLHNGILFSRMKEGAPSLCDSMDGTEEHNTKWNKPGGEIQITYDLTFNRNLINKMNKQAKYNQRHWNWEQAVSDQKGEGREF